MIHHFVTSIGGIANFGIISICLFFLVFSGAIVWAWARERSFLTRMESLPLEDGETKRIRKGNTRHE